MYLATLFHFHKSFQILPTSIPNQLKVFYIKKIPKPQTTNPRNQENKIKQCQNKKKNPKNH